MSTMTFQPGSFFTATVVVRKGDTLLFHFSERLSAEHWKILGEQLNGLLPDVKAGLLIGVHGVTVIRPQPDGANAPRADGGPVDMRPYIVGEERA